MDNSRFGAEAAHTEQAHGSAYESHQEYSSTAAQDQPRNGLLSKVFGRRTARTVVPPIHSSHERKLTEDDDLSGGSSRDLEDIERKQNLEHQEHDGEEGLLYRDGELVLMPAPTQDPKDPLNLSLTRKVIAVFFLAMFGAMAAAAELILGAVLPVFALEYANIDPKVLKPITDDRGLPYGFNPLEFLETFPSSVPIWQVYLLATSPILVIGVANLFFIPLAVAMGRRSIVLISGLIAIGGAIWAGKSTSLGTHIGARCIQAIGAGTVESLIPFTIQDMVFVHQRNMYISAAFALQGVMIIALGYATPYIIIRMSWRWVYFVTAAAAGGFLIGVFFTLPETRWPRSAREINGIPRRETTTSFTPRTFKYDLQLFQGRMEWRQGMKTFVNSLKTFFYPHIFIITMVNSVMIACAVTAAYTTAPALITEPWSWPFFNLGLCLIPVLLAAIAVGVVTGYGADHVANWMAKKTGKRLPENQLVNLVLPTVAAIVGSIIYGLAGDKSLTWSFYIFLFGLGLMAFGFLGANTVGAVYMLECFPHMTGAALVNIASFRAIIAFLLCFRSAEWVADMGYFDSMVIYTACLAFFGLMVPIVYIWGPAWRRMLPEMRDDWET